MAFGKWSIIFSWILPKAISALGFPSRVELHVHLDGAIDSDVLFEICQARDLHLPSIGVPRNASDVERFVDKSSAWHRFDAINEIIGGDVSSIKLAAESFVAFQAKSGVQYTEVRYDPVRLSKSQLQNISITEEEVVRAVQEGLAIGSARHGVSVYQILCAMRGKSPKQCFETANLALKLRSMRDMGGVVGLDLAGDETDFPNAAYVDCMRYAKESGLNTTVHSGEFNKTQSKDVRSAVFLMRADRVGHGYALVQDPQLLEELRRKEVHLEACPKSALRHGAWALEAIQSFRKNQLLFGLNTDDPSTFFSNTSAAADEAIVRDYLNFTDDDIRAAYASAFKARFGGRHLTELHVWGEKSAFRFVVFSCDLTFLVIKPVNQTFYITVWILNLSNNYQQLPNSLFLKLSPLVFCCSHVIIYFGDRSACIQEIMAAISGLFQL